MHRLFLDANVLFSAAYRPDAGLRKFWHLGVELMTSEYAREEAARNLARPEQRRDLQELLSHVTVSAAAIADRVIEGAEDLHEKDRPIMLAAIASGATHLITGDFRHFGTVYGKRIEGVLVLAPAAYLAAT